MLIHPFSPERHIGYIHQVEGTVADVTLSAAHTLPYARHGEYVGRGEVGQFVIIDVGGRAIFGRILRVTMPSRYDFHSSAKTMKSPSIEGRIHLLSTLELNGKTSRGIGKYPKIGDPVYAANAETILSVIGASEHAGFPLLHLGTLSLDESTPVKIPLTRLFGRHLAVVGATGSGKSWTLGHLAESISLLKGKMILIDATGEFRTLSTHTKHLTLGSTNEEPDAQLVCLPYYSMTETDLHAFFNPSSGLQLPKLREAIRTLRLLNAAAKDKNREAQFNPFARPASPFQKAFTSISLFQSARAHYIKEIENPYGRFDLHSLAAQVQNECIFQTNRGNYDQYGDINWNEVGYVSSLVSRINDLTSTPEVMVVISPSTPTPSVYTEIKAWLKDPDSHILRISLRNVTFTNSLREIIVNILGRDLLQAARKGYFQENPLVIALDEAHQFFNITIGNEFTTTQLNAFDSIAKEGRKYGLTLCIVTQRPGDLPAGVLSQVGMTIAHRLADARDRQRIEQAAAEIDQSATKLLPGLVPGEAILMGAEFPVPVSVRIQKPLSPPASDGPNYTSWISCP